MPTTRTALILTLAAVYLSGCAAAANYRPVIDTQGVDSVAYERDLAECQRYAQQVDPAGRAVAGAVAGALVAGLLGAALGVRDPSLYRFGAVVGGVQGAGQGVLSQIDITRNCLVGRNYRVLQ